MKLMKYVDFKLSYLKEHIYLTIKEHIYSFLMK